MKKRYDIKWCFFDISILHQVLEIGQFHQFPFTSQQPCQTLNSTSSDHSTYQRVTTLNLAKLFHSEVCRHTSKMNNKRYLLTQQKYHLRRAALRNFTRLPFRFIPPSLWVYQKTKKRSVCYGCGSIFTNKYDNSLNNIIIKHVHRRIRGEIGIGNVLFNADFTAPYYQVRKSPITKKNSSFSGNIHIKVELPDKRGSKIQ